MARTGTATRHFDFEALDWDGVFIPGQFLSLTADDITRAYSIASPPDGPRFGLCANLVSGGQFSPWLFALKPGDEIEFKGPYGVFTRVQAVRIPFWLPPAPAWLRFVRFWAARSKATCTLILGTRHESGLLYDAEWRELAAARADFVYWPTLTRPSHEWRGLTGRVQPHVMHALGERRDIDVYICGLHDMVNELRAQLKAAGLDRKRIIYEKYD